MTEVTLKFAEGYMTCCPLCGVMDGQNPVRYSDGENWIKCSRCGTTYKRVWQAAGSCANRKIKEKM